MAYTQPTEETIEGIEGLGLSPDQETSLIDFIETTIGADGEVETEQLSAEDDAPVAIPDDVEQAIITSGGTFIAPDDDVLVIVQTDGPVTIVGDPADGDRIVVVGSDGDDGVFLDGVLPDGDEALAATDGENLPPGSGYVIGREGDETITGSDGDDTIDGGGGDDTIDAGAGDDTIMLGEGSDAVDGGGGFDVARYKTAASEDVTVTFADGVLEIARTGEDEVVDTDTIAGVEYVGFTEGGPELVLETDADADIARLYEVLVDRAADAEGLDFWLWAADEGLSTETLAFYMLGSEEFQSQLPEDPAAADIVELMYNQGLGRDSDSDGLAFWTGLVEEGTLSPEEVAVFFASSPEAVDLYDYIHVLPDNPPVPDEPDMM